MYNKIKAILFDMDGVLVEAKDWHYEALNKALRIFGFEISRYEHLHAFDGLPTKEKLKMISQRYYLPESLHPFINELKQSFTMDYVAELCHPVFVHEYALSKLKNEGYKIAVCSNSIRNSIEVMMNKSALTPYLDLIVSNEDVANSKPDPEIYIKAMSLLGVKPEECIICEDNINGINAAIASGGNLLKINEVTDVNYGNIKSFIKELEVER
jgi:beta-phosphoglucomutase-like phosphatase (HAD superfamily)